MDHNYTIYYQIHDTLKPFSSYYVPGEPGDPLISGNTNVTDDWLCYGQIKGDPDIAGWGVFAGFFLNAIIVVLASLWLWHPKVRHQWRHHGQQQPANDEPDLSPAEAFPLTLGDTQLVSGVAIIVASLVNLSADKNYPLYHLFISRSLAGLCITGHNAGLYYVYGKLQKNHPVSLWMRFVVTLLFVLLYEVWGGIALARFRPWGDAWPSFTPQCFSYRLNAIPGILMIWMKISLAWMPLSYMWVYTRPVRLSEHVDPLFDRLDTWIAIVVKDLLTFGYWKGVLRQSSPQPWWKAGVRFCLGTAFALFRTVLALVAIVMSLLFFTTTYLQPISALLFLVWDAYDVITIKLSNRLVVVDHLETDAPAAPPANPEFGWGFWSDSADDTVISLDHCVS